MIFYILNLLFPSDTIPQAGTIWRERGSEGDLRQFDFEIRAANRKEVEYALATRKPDGSGVPCIPQPPNTLPRREFLADFYQT